MSRVTLFEFDNANISINIEAYFDDQGLVVDGNDIGNRVSEMLGDIDYEYQTTVSDENLIKLFSLFNIELHNRSGLLMAIAEKFIGNSCYSEFNSFLLENGIQSGGFSWT